MIPFLYTFTYRYLINPLAFFLVHILKFTNSKIKTGIFLRKKQNGIYPWLLFPKNQQPIWIHCSSGEFEYVKPVLREIKKQTPNKKTLVTYFSPSVKKNIEQSEYVDFLSPLPWDRVKLWKDFLDHHKPEALLIARTDLWPEMLLQCKKRNLPTLLFSATLSSNSGRLRFFARNFYSHILSQLSEIYCVDKDDYTNFKSINPKILVSVKGDTRYDQVIYRLQHPNKIKNELFTLVDKKRTFIAGSTWAEDEEIIIPALKEIKNNNIPFKTILAPHEPSKNHLDQLTRLIKKNNLTYQIYTSSTSWNESDILIIDSVGILADLYSKASIAFVGGSFKKTVHSVMEPLASGCLTFLGPKHHNNREALLFKKITVANQFTAIKTCNTSSELHQDIENYFKNINHQKIQKEIKEEIQLQAGKSTEVYNWLKNR